MSSVGITVHCTISSSSSSSRIFIRRSKTKVTKRTLGPNSTSLYTLYDRSTNSKMHNKLYKIGLSVKIEELQQIHNMSKQRSLDFMRPLQ